jgi:hypothetical protein
LHTYCSVQCRGATFVLGIDICLVVNEQPCTFLVSLAAHPVECTPSIYTLVFIHVQPWLLLEQRFELNLFPLTRKLTCPLLENLQIFHCCHGQEYRRVICLIRSLSLLVLTFGPHTLHTTRFTNFFPITCLATRISISINARHSNSHFSFASIYVSEVSVSLNFSRSRFTRHRTPERGIDADFFLSSLGAQTARFVCKNGRRVSWGGRPGVGG